MSLENDLNVFTEKAKKRGLGYYCLKEGEEIYRVFKRPNGDIEKIIKGTLEKIIVTFNGNDRLFTKRMKVTGYNEEFSVKKFKRYYNIIKL